MKKRGRKISLVLNDEIIKEIEKLAGNGLTQKQIANYYGIGTTTWHKMKKKNAELNIACKKGKAATIAEVTGKLMQQIKMGNLTAIIFYLKTQAGWKEKNSLSIDSSVKSKKNLIKIETDDPIEASKIYQQIMTGSQ